MFAIERAQLRLVHFLSKRQADIFERQRSASAKQPIAKLTARLPDQESAFNWDKANDSLAKPESEIRTEIEKAKSISHGSRRRHRSAAEEGQPPSGAASPSASLRESVPFVL